MDSRTAAGDRLGERRAVSRFVLPERRSGFDRRRRSVLGDALIALRDSPPALLGLLGAVNVMNVIDQVATTHALAAGFAEGNPVMAGLIAADPRLAAFAKLTSIALVSAGVWRLRHYRAILQIGIFMFAVFTGALLIHLYDAAFYY